MKLRRRSVSVPPELASSGEGTRDRNRPRTRSRRLVMRLGGRGTAERELKMPFILSLFAPDRNLFANRGSVALRDRWWGERVGARFGGDARSGGAPNYAPSLRSVAGLLVAR